MTSAALRVVAALRKMIMRAQSCKWAATSASSAELPQAHALRPSKASAPHAMHRASVPGWHVTQPLTTQMIVDALPLAPWDATRCSTRGSAGAVGDAVSIRAIALMALFAARASAARLQMAPAARATAIAR